MSNRKHKNKKKKSNQKTKNYNNKKRSGLGAIFDKHITCEFADRDVDATMKTMVKHHMYITFLY